MFWQAHPTATWWTSWRYASITSIFLYWNQYLLIRPIQQIHWLYMSVMVCGLPHLNLIALVKTYGLLGGPSLGGQSKKHTAQLLPPLQLILSQTSSLWIFWELNFSYKLPSVFTWTTWMCIDLCGVRLGAWRGVLHGGARPAGRIIVASPSSIVYRLSSHRHRLSSHRHRLSVHRHRLSAHRHRLSAHRHRRIDVVA